MTPSLLDAGVVASTLEGEVSPFDVPITTAVPAGSLLWVTVADQLGFFANTLTGVTDSQGNAYELDSDVNQADGDGSIYVAHSITTSDLTSSDTLTLTWTGGTWPAAYAYAASFSGVGGLRLAGTPVGGTDTPTTLAPSVAGSAGDLAIGAATYVGPLGGFEGVVTNDGLPWIPLLVDGGDLENTLYVSYQVLASTGVVTYTTSSTNPFGRDSAAVVVAYTPSGGGGSSSIVAGVPLTGLIPG